MFMVSASVVMLSFNAFAERPKTNTTSAASGGIVLCKPIFEKDEDGVDILKRCEKKNCQTACGVEAGPDGGPICGCKMSAPPPVTPPPANEEGCLTRPSCGGSCKTISGKPGTCSRDGTAGRVSRGVSGLTSALTGGRIPEARGACTCVATK